MIAFIPTVSMIQAENDSGRLFASDIILDADLAHGRIVTDGLTDGLRAFRLR